MQKSIFLPFVLLVVWLFSCAPVKPGETLNSEAFARKIGKENTVLIDVRTPAEFDSIHIAGALLIDYKDSSFTTKISALDKHKTYLLYCRSGRRSDAASKKMAETGFLKVYQLKGGIEAWNGITETNKK